MQEADSLAGQWGVLVVPRHAPEIASRFAAAVSPLSPHPPSLPLQLHEALQELSNTSGNPLVAEFQCVMLLAASDLHRELEQLSHELRRDSVAFVPVAGAADRAVIAHLTLLWPEVAVVPYGEEAELNRTAQSFGLTASRLALWRSLWSARNQDQAVSVAAHVLHARRRLWFDPSGLRRAARRELTERLNIEGHGTGGALASIAEHLLVRARSLTSHGSTFEDAIHCALLSSEALAALGGRNPTSSLEATRLFVWAEAQAELRAAGSARDKAATQRLRELRALLRAIVARSGEPLPPSSHRLSDLRNRLAEAVDGTCADPLLVCVVEDEWEHALTQALASFMHLSEVVLVTRFAELKALEEALAGLSNEAVLIADRSLTFSDTMEHDSVMPDERGKSFPRVFMAWPRAIVGVTFDPRLSGDIPKPLQGFLDARLAARLRPAGASPLVRQVVSPQLNSFATKTVALREAQWKEAVVDTTSGLGRLYEDRDQYLEVEATLATIRHYEIELRYHRATLTREKWHPIFRAGGDLISAVQLLGRRWLATVARHWVAGPLLTQVICVLVAGMVEGAIAGKAPAESFVLALKVLLVTLGMLDDKALPLEAGVLFALVVGRLASVLNAGVFIAALYERVRRKW